MNVESFRYKSKDIWHVAIKYVFELKQKDHQFRQAPIYRTHDLIEEKLFVFKGGFLTTNDR